MVRIGISGFGRIGRLALRRILTLPDAEVVAINNRTVGEIMAHLLKYDSVHGTMKEDPALPVFSVTKHNNEVFLTAKFTLHF